MYDLIFFIYVFSIIGYVITEIKSEEHNTKKVILILPIPLYNTYMFLKLIIPKLKGVMVDVKIKMGKNFRK